MKMMDGMMDGIICIMFGSILGIVIGLVIGIGIITKSTTCNSEIALKLANTMNSSMLDCVTKQVITKEQVHDIETIFHKHIEENFKGIKAYHGTKNDEKNE